MTSPPARRLAAELRRRGLAAPARLLADAHRPLAPLISELGVAAGPFLGLLGGGAGDLRELVEDERGLDRLILELDEGADADTG